MQYMTQLIRIRWFNDACYQIELSNGVSVLVDPYIDSSPLKATDSSVLERVDYILVSHTHFDHVLDLKKIAERFQAQVFVGRESALELARQCDLAGWQVNPCTPGDTHYLDGFVLHSYTGKHTCLGEMDRPSNWPENLRREKLAEGTLKLNMLGSYEYTNYILELPQHMRILIWGGGATPHAIREAKEYLPNVSIAQLPREKPEQVAALYAAIGGQIIFPHHHDSFLAKGAEGQAVIDEVLKKSAELAPDTRVVCPEKGKWYSFQTVLSMEV